MNLSSFGDRGLRKYFTNRDYFVSSRHLFLFKGGICVNKRIDFDEKRIKIKVLVFFKAFSEEIVMNGSR